MKIKTRKFLDSNELSSGMSKGILNHGVNKIDCPGLRENDIFWVSPHALRNRAPAISDSDFNLKPYTLNRKPVFSYK
jgi:hypothetical protein